MPRAVHVTSIYPRLLDENDRWPPHRPCQKFARFNPRAQHTEESVGTGNEDTLIERGSMGAWVSRLLGWEGRELVLARGCRGGYQIGIGVHPGGMDGYRMFCGRC